MKRSLIAGAVGAAAVLTLIKTPRPGAIRAVETQTVAEVVKVDRRRNTVTIKDPSGRTVDVGVPPEVHNLSGVGPGDLLDLRYVPPVALSIAKAGLPLSSDEETARLSLPGGAPAEVVVQRKHVAGTAQALDRKRRELVLRTHDGRLLALQAPSNAAGFDQTRDGESVVLEYTEAVALAAARYSEARTSSK